MGEKSRSAKERSMRESVDAGEAGSRGGMLAVGSRCSEQGDATVCVLGRQAGAEH